MGYRLVTTKQLGAIWRQLKVVSSNRAIAHDLGFDRKTVNAYAEKILALGIEPSASYGEALIRIAALLDNGKAKPSMAILGPFEDEIRTIIGGDRESGRLSMKAKTTWLVISECHAPIAVGTSYETFERFVREHRIEQIRPGLPVRIETESGDEI